MDLPTYTFFYLNPYNPGFIAAVMREKAINLLESLFFCTAIHTNISLHTSFAIMFAKECKLSPSVYRNGFHSQFLFFFLLLFLSTTTAPSVLLPE